MRNALPFYLILCLGAMTMELSAGAKPEQINRLSSDLTPVGAERAGNASGSIPEWTGGITRPPDNYKPGDHHQDPFSGETPLLRIDQQNVHHSAALLSAGHIAMLQRYADYFIDVYPTHRSAALPQRVYQKNAGKRAHGNADRKR